MKQVISIFSSLLYKFFLIMNSLWIDELSAEEDALNSLLSS